MSKKWSFEEDYIVAKFCMEKDYLLTDDDFEELVRLLVIKTNSSRSTRAVYVRVKYYIDLFLCGLDFKGYIPEQVRVFAELYGRQMKEMRLAIKNTISKNYNSTETAIETIDEAKLLIDLSDSSNNLTQFIHKIDFNLTFPMVLQKYLDLKGLKNRDVYRQIGMKADTFSSILRGKNDSVKKENVLRLCVGLRLTVAEAEELMASAGYLFSNAIMIDVVIKACLSCRIYNPILINIELYENGIKDELFIIDN